MGKKKGDDSDGGGELISKPHPHDVLCGRGGLTNQHTGNEWFRRLVRSNRPLYRSCPKHTKLLVAKAIVQAVQQQEPAGRFLELADRNEGVWRQISYKRAVDKTSQALREKDPPVQKGSAPLPALDPPLKLPDEDIQNEAAAAAAKAAAQKGKRKEEDLSDLATATLKQAGFLEDEQKVTPASAILPPPVDLGKKRKATAKPEFIKPSWWGRSAPVDTSQNDNSEPPNKKTKSDDPIPPPPEPLQTRQSSLFRFLSNTSIFGGGSDQEQQEQPQPQQQSNSFFSFSSGNVNNNSNNIRNPGDMISQEAATFQRQQPNNQHRMSFSSEMPPPPDSALRDMGSSTYMLDPLPLDDQGQQQPQPQQEMQPQGLQNNPMNSFEEMQRQMQQRMLQMQQHMQQQMQLQMEQFRRANMNKNPMDMNMNMGMNMNNMMNNGMGNMMNNGMGNSMNNGMSNGMNNGMGNGMNNMMNNGMNSNNDQMLFGTRSNNPRNSLFDENISAFPNGMDNPQAAFQNNRMAGGSAVAGPLQGPDDDAPPPVNRLSSQVSDWLTSFWPLGKEATEVEPPPPSENLERSVSSTIINFARSPSQFLTSLRTGVSSMFGDNNNSNNGSNRSSTPAAVSTTATTRTPSGTFGNPVNNSGSALVIGTESKGSSLLDDYEETPMETRLRTGISG